MKPPTPTQAQVELKNEARRQKRKDAQDTHNAAEALSTLLALLEPLPGKYQERVIRSACTYLEIKI